MKTKSHALGMFLAIALIGTGCESVSSSNAEPTLQSIQTEVFDVTCATGGCHDATTQAGALDLSSVEASYQSLVMAPAGNAVASANGWLRVKPYEPELSFLIRKVEQPGIGEGAPMPLGKYELTDFYVNLISEWIARGAEQ